jgi:hypothetical protein
MPMMIPPNNLENIYYNLYRCKSGQEVMILDEDVIHLLKEGWSLIEAQKKIVEFKKQSKKIEET